MPTYLYTLSGFPSGATTCTARRFDNETGLWATLASPPTGATTVLTPDIAVRQEGGWDGSYWYAILANGKLYRYNPTADSWSAPLASGSVLITDPAEDQNWAMESDGRFLYLYNSSGFRRYDPTNDVLQALSDLSTGTWGNRIFLEYDGNDYLYSCRGGDNAPLIYRYQISTATWVQRATANISTGFGVYMAWGYLQGKLLRCDLSTSNGFGAHTYDPSTNAWQASGTQAMPTGINPDSPYGEIDDSTLRVWNCTAGGSSKDFNVATNQWGTGPSTAWNFDQLNNFAVARLFNPSFTWYLSDGTTLAGASVNLGSVVVGDTLSTELKVSCATDRPAGVTVSVPTLPGSDAEDPVTICATSNGTFGTSFTVAPLTTGIQFSIFLKLSPTYAQTLGFAKRFNLKITAL